MSGIAHILLKRGFKVQGSDIRENDAVRRLRWQGAKIYLSHHRDNIGEAKEVVYSSAISSDNAELLAAREKKLPIFSRGQMLASLMSNTESIAVCGTHGKTTTTSLISFLLLHAGLDPTFIVGGDIQDFGGNAYAGDGNLFVAEADESDGSFLMLSPSFEVVTNIEEEHMDYYKTFINLKDAFFEYIENIRDGGWLIAGGDDVAVRNILFAYKDRIRAHIITYGVGSSNTMCTLNICQKNNRTFFDVIFGKKRLGRTGISLHGIHNVANTLPAIALGLLHGISWEKIAEILPEFKGVERRFQMKGRYNNALIIDDYAHHPTEIQVTLRVTEEFNPKRRLAIFQPHRYTRTRDMASQFAEALKSVDLPILIPIYAASEKPIPGITVELIGDYLKRYGKCPLYFENKEEVVSYLRKTVKPRDVVLTLGAGDVYKIGEELVED